jgi:hypothetical protein
MREVLDARRCSLGWARAAHLGQTAWLVGNLYEGLVGMPQLLADARSRRPPGLFTAGSPVRYYAPVAPFALSATGLTLCRAGGPGATA